MASPLAAGQSDGGLHRWHPLNHLFTLPGSGLIEGANRFFEVANKYLWGWLMVAALLDVTASLTAQVAWLAGACHDGAGCGYARCRGLGQTASYPCPIAAGEKVAHFSLQLSGQLQPLGVKL